NSNRLNTPNLSLNGADNKPERVVAPTNVNGGKSILTDLALGPVPITISKKKSSIAGSSTSSTTLGNRSTSSINKTSPGSSDESIAAKSPALSIAGPEVERNSTSISFAIIAANVVLPSPGGPNNNT